MNDMLVTSACVNKFSDLTRIGWNFKRRKTMVYGPYTLLQADTIFYRNYSRQNSGYKYILVVIDCFSRKNWVDLSRSWLSW